MHKGYDEITQEIEPGTKLDRVTKVVKKIHLRHLLKDTMHPMEYRWLSARLQ